MSVEYRAYDLAEAVSKHIGADAYGWAQTASAAEWLTLAELYGISLIPAVITRGIAILKMREANKSIDPFAGLS